MLEQVETEYGHRIVIELARPGWSADDGPWPPPIASPSVRDAAMRKLGAIEYVVHGALGGEQWRDVKVDVEARTGRACTGCGTINDGPDPLPGGLLRRGDWCCEPAWDAWVDGNLKRGVVALIVPDGVNRQDVYRAGTGPADTHYDDWAEVLDGLTDGLGPLVGTQWIIESDGCANSWTGDAWQYENDGWRKLDEHETTQRPTKIAKVIGAQ